MSLFITSLNSGSNGNCYYVANKKEAILIDCGISCKEVEKRMLRLQLDIHHIKAIFISHEHSDHIKGVEVLSKKYGIPVYCTIKTSGNCGFSSGFSQIKYFAKGDQIKIGELLVQSFFKKHDAIDPCSFLVKFKKIKVGIFTDLGIVCSNLVHYFSQCDAAFLEANYDKEMLGSGNYPWHLKKRISGGSGHLSNDEAFSLFTTHRSPALTHLILAHLSKNNNCPQKLAHLFSPYSGELNITIASRDKESPLFEIGIKKSNDAPTVHPKYVQAQLSFF
ncbi:MAG: MBL fold metallo-hydrolase [Bacteroidetes bacterium]|nr:MBL fold metallo-hydrolase [Bacteroidota bacterium]